MIYKKYVLIDREALKIINTNDDPKVLEDLAAKYSVEGGGKPYLISEVVTAVHYKKVPDIKEFTPEEAE